MCSRHNLHTQRTSFALSSGLAILTRRVSRHSGLSHRNALQFSVPFNEHVSRHETVRGSNETHSEARLVPRFRTVVPSLRSFDMSAGPWTICSNLLIY